MASWAESGKEGERETMVGSRPGWQSHLGNGEVPKRHTEWWSSLGDARRMYLFIRIFVWSYLCMQVHTLRVAVVSPHSAFRGSGGEQFGPSEPFESCPHNQRVSSEKRTKFAQIPRLIIHNSTQIGGFQFKLGVFSSNWGS